MSIGTKVEIKGESEYKKAIRNISNELKVLSSEMKLTSSEFNRSDDAMENAKNMSKTLNKQIDQQVQTIMGLQEALNMAKREYGENSRETANWQSKLNLAKAELNNLNNKLDDNEKNMKDLEKSTEDLGEELENGSKKASVFGDVLKANLLSEGILSGIKALGSAIKTIGSSFVNMGKQAFDSYANYQQLVGGVETLFGAGGKTIEEYAESVGKSVDEIKGEYDKLIESQNKVMNNANIAYKTSGLSANEYMETVTSFSASLLQSLKGNTEEAVDYSNRAIIDMSDNANKMGTNMSMIQNTYQGFAKQNYTMLDNLKLG